MACLSVVCLSLIFVEKELPGTSVPSVLHSLIRAFLPVPMRESCRLSSAYDVSHKKDVFTLYCMGSCGRKHCCVPGKQTSCQPACPRVLTGKTGQHPVSNFQWHFSTKFNREGQILTYLTVSNHLALCCVSCSMPMLQNWACLGLLHRGPRKF